MQSRQSAISGIESSLLIYLFIKQNEAQPREKTNTNVWGGKNTQFTNWVLTADSDTVFTTDFWQLLFPKQEPSYSTPQVQTSFKYTNTTYKNLNINYVQL